MINIFQFKSFIFQVKETSLIEKFVFFLFFEYNRKVLYRSLIEIFNTSTVNILSVDWFLLYLILNIILTKLDFFVFSRSFYCNTQNFSSRFADYFIFLFKDIFLLSIFESKVQFFLLKNFGGVVSYLKNSFKVSKNNFKFLNFQILLDSSKYSRINFSKIFVIRFLIFFKYFIEKNCNIST